MTAMKLGATLNGFTIVTTPTNTDAGMSQWCHVERNGERFFMKMYLAPKYPTSSSPGTPEGKARRRAECEAFERRHLTIANRLKGDAPGGGHLVTTLAFFRVGPAYYKVTRLVDIDHRVNLTEQDPETRAIALRSLLFSVRLMHDEGIVHGDLKPDNVLFQRTPAGAVTSKLIDFDEAYLSGEPPAVMHIVGDPLYYSPEMFAYVKQAGGTGPSELTLASDVFSLAVLIHVLLTGDLPFFDTSRFSYPCEAISAGEPLALRETLPVGAVRQMLTTLVAADPRERPGINTVIAAFRAEDLRTAAEGAMPELTRAERVAVRRLHELAMVKPAPLPATRDGKGGAGDLTSGGDAAREAGGPKREGASLWAVPRTAGSTPVPVHAGTTGSLRSSLPDRSSPGPVPRVVTPRDPSTSSRLRSTFARASDPAHEAPATEELLTDPALASPPDHTADGSPRDGSPRDGSPGDGAPGDGAPGDGAPGDGAPGDGSPRDGAPGDSPPGATAPDGSAHETGRAGAPRLRVGPAPA